MVHRCGVGFPGIFLRLVLRRRRKKLPEPRPDFPGAFHFDRLVLSCRARKDIEQKQRIEILLLVLLVQSETDESNIRVRRRLFVCVTNAN